jgi:hypothetical protein
VRAERAALANGVPTQTIRDVVQDYLMNKTVFFVGDSINGQVYQAAVRFVTAAPAATTDPLCASCARSCAGA